jgi:hypothetical protein
MHVAFQLFIYSYIEKLNPVMALASASFLSDDGMPVQNLPNTASDRSAYRGWNVMAVR